MLTAEELHQIISIIQAGKILAYPTEGVFGLGCDPYQESAVMKLLALKERPVEKGLIVIADRLSVLEPWLREISPEHRQKIETTSHPTTWVVPATAQVPVWIRGEHTQVAIRITQHPVAQAICRALGTPFVSTSANRAGDPPALTAQDVRAIFPTLDYIVDQPTGNLAKPTPIIDLLTGEFLRI